MRFSDWSEEGQTVWSSRRVKGGKRGQRSGIGAIPIKEGGAASLGCSPPARRRRAAVEVGATDKRLRLEGAATSTAWPRARPADGGRPGTEMGTLHFVAEDSVTDEYTLTLGAHFLLWGFPLVLVLLVVAETLLDTWWREPRR